MLRRRPGLRLPDQRIRAAQLRFQFRPRLTVSALRRLQKLEQRFRQSQHLVAVLFPLFLLQLKIAHRREKSLLKFRAIFIRRFQTERFHAQLQIRKLPAEQFRFGIRFRQAVGQRLDRFMLERQLLPQLRVLREERGSGHFRFRVFNFGF